MRQKHEIAILLVALAVVGILAARTAMAQNAAPVSLEEQLQAQYQLVRMGPDANGTKVLEPGTVLVIQKDGIFGVPPTSTKVCRSRYQSAKVDSPEALCPAAVRKNSRSFKVGENVYPSQIEVDLKKGKISLGLIACDSCNGTNPPTSLKSQVIFQFAQGYLEKASVPDVEDTIAQVFAIYTPPETPPAPLPEPPVAAPATPGQGLTNDDIIKLVQGKLADSLIITKIKSSACTFDTSANELVRLKQAGVSDAVLQAMVEAGSQPMAAPPAPPTPPSAETALPSACSDYASCLASGRAALGSSQWDQSVGYLQKASSLDPSKPDAWVEMGKAYLATGQYQDAVAMWDKALGLGGTLTLGIWHYAGLHGFEMGTFHLGAKEVSFVLADEKRVFSVAPTEASSVKSHHPPMGGSAWSFGMKVGGRNYWFSYVPLGVQCNTPLRCNDPAGFDQEGAVSNYVAQKIGELAPGSSGK